MILIAKAATDLLHLGEFTGVQNILVTKKSFGHALYMVATSVLAEIEAYATKAKICLLI